MKPSATPEVAALTVSASAPAASSDLTALGPLLQALKPGPPSTRHCTARMPEDKSTWPQESQKAGWLPWVAGLAAQSLAFWLVLLVLGLSPVRLGVWLALGGLAAAGVIALYSRPQWALRWPARTWVAAAFYAGFLALLFAGAHPALDALHGADRPKAEVARHLGGLELWQVLCPGVFSFAVGSWVHRWVLDLKLATPRKRRTLPSVGSTQAAASSRSPTQDQGVGDVGDVVKPKP